MKKTYRGSCHCGSVRYEVSLDLDQGTFKCNCSICTKTRTWLAMVQPDAFHLLAGNMDLSEYQFNNKNIHHLFCKHCGVRSFGWGKDSELGKFYAVHVNCLNNVEIDELVNAPITYVDGHHDNWRSPPAEIRHL